MSVPAKPFTSTIETTKRGRRFCVCPSCSVIAAAIPIGTDRYTCRHCGADFQLTTKPERPKRQAPAP